MQFTDASTPSPDDSADHRRHAGHHVVEPSLLRSVISRGDALVLDTRPDAQYRAGHLPGARHLPAESSFLSSPAGVDHAAISAEASLWGITASTLVIAYGSHRSQPAGHALWTLARVGHTRTALVDGGYEAWWRLGLPTASTTVAPPERSEVHFVGEHLPTAHRDTWRAHADAGQLVDLRMRSRFRALPVSDMASLTTRFRTTRNVPATAFADQAGRALEPGELARTLHGFGVESRAPFVVVSDDPSAATWACFQAHVAGLEARLGVEA